MISYPTTNTSINVVFDRGLDKTSAENTNNYALSSATAITRAMLDSEDGTLVHLITDTQPVSDLDELTVWVHEKHPNGYGIVTRLMEPDHDI